MSGNTSRAIVHIDCDAFFASCEQAKDPRLKGRPVVTGRERGIIACASYEAKALGIRRGVSLRDAIALCPKLVVLPSDYETYSIYSERIFAIMRRFTPSVEEYSIDEAYCDITGLRRLYRRSYSGIVKMMKARIQKELGITVSAGLSLTKTLAKICSRHVKPDGFTAVSGFKLDAFLKEVELEKVCGFGPNTIALLNKCGIYTVLEYTMKPVTFAGKLLGKTGVELWHELRGDPIYAISTGKKESYLSISKTKTFSPASENKDYVKAQLMRNLEGAFIKLRRHNLCAKELAVYLRKSDFDDRWLKGSLDRHSSSTLDFTSLCSALFGKLFEDNTSYRATGVIVSDIVQEGIDSRTLFDDPARIAKISKISRSVDLINSSCGKYALYLASAGPAIRGQRGHPRRPGIPLLKFATSADHKI